MGQEVAARWRNTNHYLATVIELFTGETTSLSKADKDVKQNERDSEPTNIKSVPADVEETINGEKSKGKAGPLKKAQKPAKVIEKKKNKKTKNKKPVTNEDGGSDDSSEEINVIEVDVKKKKKEIEAEKKKNKEAVMAASQQVAASLFSKKTSLLRFQILPSREKGSINQKQDQMYKWQIILKLDQAMSFQTTSICWPQVLP
ncbi:uncharacterized protein LOC123566663 isoform X2 [Mercenaria mercenaria]|uniref:uncharacterized protein LOC123566663 isoform X2 n=1 Tax=Mercenaria mercenaria TaxID=6596 RepID=UPI00234EBB59|nr:uncharacterized protein LOC123566663 isoform X2 [Mercenaria mercenaria]